MKRPWQAWLVFAFFAASILAGTYWLTIELRTADAKEKSLRQKNEYDSQVRQILWQMDTDLAPLVSDEAARPYYEYRSFYAAEGAYDAGKSVDQGRFLVPSPLLKSSGPDVRVHFMIGPSGDWTSPQVPFGKMRDLALERYITEADKRRYFDRMQDLKTRLADVDLLDRLPRRRANDGALVSIEEVAMGPEVVQKANNEDINAYNSRAVQTKDMAQKKRAMNENRPAPLQASETFESPMTALIIDNEWILARHVKIDGRDYVQGAWLDRTTIEARLMTFADGLDQPMLIGNLRDASPDRRLVGLPLALHNKAPQYDDGDVGFALTMTLAGVWALLLTALMGAGFVLHRTLTLSERRADFASAVTHELRTPLTTLRMYAEMLSGDMLDETQRKDYLATLDREAQRLAGLVDNVLAFSRLERGRFEERLQATPVGSMLDGFATRLTERAKQDGLELVLDCETEASVKCDASAVEQILFNLIDNACKYAGDADTKRIELTCRETSQGVEISVRDFGAGIQGPSRRRIFEPFRKSADEATRTSHGVGLGLSLCRKLARAMGGDLRLDNATETGARFVLSLKC